MTNHYANKLKAYKRIQAYNTKYHLLLTAIDDYDLESTSLDTAVSAIETAENIQQTETKGLADASAAAKKAMALVTIKYARKAMPKARNAKNADLIKQLNHFDTFITGVDMVLSVSRANDIKKALNDNLTICTNITPANITEIGNAISAFATAEILPTSARKTKKATGTDVMPPAFKQADEAVENMFDYVYGEFIDTNSAMVDEFSLDMQIVDSGIHHTGLIAFCIDTNPPPDAPSPVLENVMVTIVELNLIAHSDINGLAGIAKIKPGTYHVEFSLAGYVTKKMIIRFRRGHMEEVQVELTKA